MSAERVSGMRKRDRTKRESNYDEQRENELYCANKESNDCDAQTKRVMTVMRKQRE